jgi:hypothetical protein
MGYWSSNKVRLVPVAAFVLFALAGASAGCESELETGYKPRKVGATSAQRRGYYASPFTPEAKAAGLEREQEIEARRPTPGY